MILDLYQSLQKIKVLLVWLAPDNKEKILIEAFNEMGTCSKAINIRRITINDGWVFNKLLFFEVNL